MAREEILFLVPHSRLIVHDDLIPSLRAIPQTIDTVLCLLSVTVETHLQRKHLLRHSLRGLSPGAFLCLCEMRHTWWEGGDKASQLTT